MRKFILYFILYEKTQKGYPFWYNVALRLHYTKTNTVGSKRNFLPVTFLSISVNDGVFAVVNKIMFNNGSWQKLLR